MRSEILNEEKSGRKKYVSLSVKVVDIHLSDCINASNEPVYINEGIIDNKNFTGGANFGTWSNPNYEN